MNKLNITYKRGTTFFCGADEKCIHVIFNGEHILNIFKFDGGFTAYELDGEFFCGGFDVLLRDCKETIERLLAQREQQGEQDLLEQVLEVRNKAMNAFDEACRMERSLERAISREVDLMNYCSEPIERIQCAEHINTLRVRRSEVRKDMKRHMAKAQEMQGIAEHIRNGREARKAVEELLQGFAQ